MRRWFALMLLTIVLFGVVTLRVAYVAGVWLREYDVDVRERTPRRRAYDWRARKTGTLDPHPAPVSLLPQDAPLDADLTVERLVPKDANMGTLTRGPGSPSNDPGSWSMFRGDTRTNIAPPEEKLLQTWPPDGPEVLWARDLGVGHAGFAVRGGCVFIVDYNKEKREDTIRCLSLADGKEIWNYSYYVFIKNYHGITRTVAAVNDDYVVALGPHCNVTCLRAKTGERVWHMDLVKEFGTVIPEWYAGQCPLIEGDRVILAPGGDPLMMAVRLADGEIVWKTPNPVPLANASRQNRPWGMTHASIMPMIHKGVRQYVYNTTRGVVGVRAADGKRLWQTEDWIVNTANVASPVVIDGERIFFAGGYKSGAAMFRLIGEGDAIAAQQIFRIRDDRVFSASQQTPILYEGHLYGVIQRGELVCLSLDGEVLWSSGSSKRFGLGPFLLADGMLLVLNDENGALHLVEATSAAYRERAHAKVLDGRHAWAPMALVNGKLLLRDDTRMKCLRVGTREQ